MDFTKEMILTLDDNTIKQKLQSALGVKRYKHTLGVAETAVTLSKIYGGDINKSYTAGLLHDCAKDYPDDLKMRLCKEYHIHLDDVMKKNKELIHPFLGAEIAVREYKVSDKDIINAIKYHTTGRPEMSLLEKIIFCADYIEPNRKPFEGIQKARDICLDGQNIDAAVAFILKQTIEYINQNKKPLHTSSVEAYKYYSGRTNNAR